MNIQQMFIHELKAKQDFNRDCIRPGTVASDVEKNKLKALCNASSIITNVLDEIKSLGIVDRTGRNLSYNIQQNKVGEKDCTIVLNILFGNDLGIGFQYNQDHQGVEYVYGGYAHRIDDEKTLQKNLQQIVKNIAESTCPDFLNKKLGLLD